MHKSQYEQFFSLPELSDIVYGRNLWKYYYFDYNGGFKIDSSLETKYSVLGSDLESFFLNTLTCEKTIRDIRSITRKVFSQIYPDINLLGDKLF